jgi:hypothetical protein
VTERNDRSGIDRLVHDDPNDARELRANLAVFARRTGDPRIRSMVTDVLAGRRDVREVFHTKEFSDAVSDGIGKIEAGIEALTDEEREWVFDRSRPRTPQSTLDQLRDDAAPAPPPAGGKEVEDNVLRDSW